MKQELEPTTVPHKHKQTSHMRFHAILTHAIGTERGKNAANQVGIGFLILYLLGTWYKQNKAVFLLNRIFLIKPKIWQK